MHIICTPYYCLLCELTHWGLVTPFGDIDLGQHRLRWWLDALRHQAITWTNVDLSSVRSTVIHLRAISSEVPQPPFAKVSLKITYLKLNWNLPGANELMLCHLSIIHLRFGCGWGTKSLVFSEMQLLIQALISATVITNEVCIWMSEIHLWKIIIMKLHWTPVILLVLLS